MSEFEKKIKELEEIITSQKKEIESLKIDLKDAEDDTKYQVSDKQDEIDDLEYEVDKYRDFNGDSKTQYAGLLFDLCVKMSNYSGNPYDLEKLLTENKII